MTAIILAAGYGTRLYPLTLDKPKALLEVDGKTILDRLIKNIEESGLCKKAIIVTNEKFYGKFTEWSGKMRTSFPIRVINDKTKTNETRLGAIGDINLALEIDKTDDDLLITGSDNLFDDNLSDFLHFAAGKKPYSSIALFDVKDKSLATKYGICSLDSNLQVSDFEEKPKNPKSTLAASALYFIAKENIAKIFEYMKTSLTKDAPGNLMKWLAGRDKLFGYVLRGTWYDIGDKESLHNADSEFRRKEKEK